VTNCRRSVKPYAFVGSDFRGEAGCLCGTKSGGGVRSPDELVESDREETSEKIEVLADSVGDRVGRGGGGMEGRGVRPACCLRVTELFARLGCGMVILAA
jgi:hypothetical protein